MNNILIHPITRQDINRIEALESHTGMRVVGRKTLRPRLVSKQVYTYLLNAAQRKADQKKKARRQAPILNLTPPGPEAA